MYGLNTVVLGAKLLGKVFGFSKEQIHSLVWNKAMQSC